MFITVNYNPMPRGQSSRKLAIIQTQSRDIQMNCIRYQPTAITKTNKTKELPYLLEIKVTYFHPSHLKTPAPSKTKEEPHV